MSERERPYTVQAPGASSHGAYAPPQGAALPTVDDRLVAPESHAQIINDQVIRTMGANPPHATAHAEAGHVFRGCLAPGYLCAVDQLTRTAVDTDVAPDVSVYREGTDPATGVRYLEELVFEVHDTERMSHATKKAEALVKRGVRRLFCVRLDQQNVFEWSREADDWLVLEAEAEIVDACFRVPVPVRALLDRVAADEAVARAMLASKNRVIERALSEREARGEARGETRGESRGLVQGRRETLILLLGHKGLALSADGRARIDACDDAAVLDRWLARVLTATSEAELFA